MRNLWVDMFVLLTFIETEDKEVRNVRPEEYYNISSFDKKSPTVIMLENLTDFVLAGKTTHDVMESEFKVNVE